MKTTEEQYIRFIREQSDNYERTIATIVAFDSVLRYVDKTTEYLNGSHFLPGRRLICQDGSNKEVTPDVVVQLSNDYGVVAEVKLTASSDRDFKKSEEQIAKYSNDLVGWKTNNEKIKLHDVSLIVNDLYRTQGQRYFENKKFGKEFNLIASSHITESKQKIKIEKYFGCFSDGRIENKLKDAVAVPYEKILMKISTVKFYDAQPPLEYTMNVLWMSVFNEVKQRTKSVDKEIAVDCQELTKMLFSRFSFGQEDPKQPKIPREAWVREALDAFVQLDYGYIDFKDKNVYRIKYASTRKESMLEIFSKKLYQKQTKRKSVLSDETQLNFFSDVESKIVNS